MKLILIVDQKNIESQVIVENNIQICASTGNQGWKEALWEVKSVLDYGIYKHYLQMV